MASHCARLFELLGEEVRQEPQHTNIFEKMRARGTWHQFSICEAGLQILAAAATDPPLPYEPVPRKSARRPYEQWKEFIQLMARLYEGATGRCPPRDWDPYSGEAEPPFWKGVLRLIRGLPRHLSTVREGIGSGRRQQGVVGRLPG